MSRAKECELIKSGHTFGRLAITVLFFEFQSADGRDQTPPRPPPHRRHSKYYNIYVFIFIVLVSWVGALQFYVNLTAF